MAERLFGMETEYGFAVRSSDGVRKNRGRAWDEHFLDVATRCLPNLPATGCGGIFLQNGARFYFDCGHHPEMTTPECSNPWDVVRYVQAGEQMLLRVAEEMKRTNRHVGEVVIFKTNVDHGGAGTTWGCHTSFLHRTNPSVLPAQIIPHLASRIIYTGAGGFEATSNGLQFTLSPRIAHLRREVSENSTSDRGIFHTKDESLCSDGFHRLHIICGESLCSETSLFLNVGATALVVSLIEMGLRPGDAVQIADPLAAMRCFAADPTCTSRVCMRDKRNLTAVQVQRHYLEQAEAHLSHKVMPPWADHVCKQWRALLDRLETGAPFSVGSTLDWAIKFCIFSQRLAKHRFTWARPELDSNRLLIQEDDRRKSQLVLLPSKFQEVYHELGEIDTRFGQLGEHGIFSAINRGGALSHRVAGVDNIEHAVDHPPVIGRARLRGELIRRYAKEKHRYSASWEGLFDHEKSLMLDLSQPFTESISWKEIPHCSREDPDVFHVHLRHLLNQTMNLLDAGQYETAFGFMEELRLHEPIFGLSDRAEYLRLFAWVQGRRGFMDSINALDQLAEMQPMTFALANDYVCAYRYQGLTPPKAIESWIARGRQFMEQVGGPDAGPTIPFLDHFGYTQLRNGSPKMAYTVLERACRDDLRHTANPTAVARALADFADTCRALGRNEEATRALNESGRIQLEHNAQGDYANFTLTYRAKMEPDPAKARAILAEAKGLQTTNGDLMGEARTLLLEARLHPNQRLDCTRKAQIQDLRARRPALINCRLLAKVLDNWKAWSGGEPDPDAGFDHFWWL